MADKVTSWTNTKYPLMYIDRDSCCSNSHTSGGTGTFPESGTRTVPADGRGDWRKRLSHHECVTTSLNANEDRAYFDAGESYTLVKDFGCGPMKLCSDRHSGHVFRINPTTDITGDVSGLSSTVAFNRAKSAYQSDFNKKRNRLQSLVNVNERAEIARMLQGAGNLLRWKTTDYIWDVTKRVQKVWKRGQGRYDRRRKTREALAVASDAWLTYSFGIKPLISDLDTAADIVGASKPPNYFLEVYGKGEDVQAYVRNSRSRGSGSHQLQWDVINETKATVVLLGKANVGNTYNGRLRKLGLTTSDFVPTVWECIPYSFLVDYFLNVGEVIEGFCMNWTGLKWTQYTRVLSKESWVDPSTCRNTYTHVNLVAKTVSPGVSSWSRKYVQRYQYLGTLQPSLYWRLPGIGSTKWCNVAALFGGANLNYRKSMRGTLAGARV